jgi:diacylglycerol kinase family enzyme
MDRGVKACRVHEVPLSIVVFVNPRSRANRRDPWLADRFAKTLGDAGRVIAPASLDDLMEQAKRLAQAPPQVIGIHGGDGTLHRTVSALIQAFESAGGKPLPPIAILAGGTMNVVARSLGIRTKPARLLARLVTRVRAGQPPQTIVRRCLHVGQSFGFVFGNGLMANFLEEYYAKGGYGAGRAIWILTRTLLSALVWGGYARRIFRRYRGRVMVEGQALPWRSLTGVCAATVREVGLGFKLNHRADEDPDRFSVLAIHAGPVKLAQDLVPVHRGLGVDPRRAWSAVASKLVIEPEEAEISYTIDGDLYRASGPLEIGLGPPLQFVKD